MVLVVYIYVLVTYVCGGWGWGEEVFYSLSLFRASVVFLGGFHFAIYALFFFVYNHFVS